jgi:uncharacterized protein (DUF1697 family)
MHTWIALLRGVNVGGGPRIATERVAAGARALSVHYPDGIGRSTLVIPALGNGTGRNVRTVAALVAMAEG